MVFLPLEIIYIILEYEGSVRYRNGKIMKQLNLKKEKYDTLKENIDKKNRIQREFCNMQHYFFMDRKSKWKSVLEELYQNSDIKRIIYKTIHQCVPPYNIQFYYLWEEFE